MAEEGLVLGGDEGIDDEPGIFVEIEFDPALAGIGANRVAVIAADVGRQRRLVGEQLLRARQAGREQQPEEDEADISGHPGPGEAARPATLEQGVETSPDALVQADQVGHGDSEGRHDRARL